MTDISLAIIAGLIVELFTLQISLLERNTGQEGLLFVATLAASVVCGGIVYAIAYGVHLMQGISELNKNSLPVQPD
jgi:hypothetical protein